MIDSARILSGRMKMAPSAPGSEHDRLAEGHPTDRSERSADSGTIPATPNQQWLGGVGCSALVLEVLNVGGVTGVAVGRDNHRLHGGRQRSSVDTRRQPTGSRIPASAALITSPTRNGATPREMALGSPAAAATGTSSDNASHEAPKP